MDTVDTDIKAELKSQEHPDGTNWHDHWMIRSESIFYGVTNGAVYIEYIINERHEAGLPDIPEIDKRQFPSQWQIFTDNVDKEANREAQGLPPPPIAVDQTWVKTWPDYWEVTKRLALRNSAVSTNGVEYIKGHRQQAGLPPLN